MQDGLLTAEQYRVAFDYMKNVFSVFNGEVLFVPNMGGNEGEHGFEFNGIMLQSVELPTDPSKIRWQTGYMKVFRGSYYEPDTEDFFPGDDFAPSDFREAIIATAQLYFNDCLSGFHEDLAEEKYALAEEPQADPVDDEQSFQDFVVKPFQDFVVKHFKEEYLGKEILIHRFYERERESPRLQSWDESDPTKNFDASRRYTDNSCII
jgi:hypothetical protein